MRILHLIISLEPSHGGPPRVATRLAAAQAALGHDVTILSYEWGTRNLRQAVQEMAGSFPGFEKVHLDYIPWRGKVDRILAPGTKKRLSEVIHDFDVMHLHNVWEAMNRVAAAKAEQAGLPYFVQPNGILDQWCMAQKRLKKLLALRLVYRRILDGAAGLCLGNQHERDAIAPLGLTAPTTIIPLNSVFMEEVSNLPPQGEFAKRFPQLRGKPFIVFLGRLHYKKGLDFLADAFGIFAKSNSDVQLVVIGHDEGAKDDFEKRVKSHGVCDRVHLVGPLHGAAKWEAFRDAACFALPSRQEGFSIAITEALACGLPVVISKECHFPEVAEAGAGVVTELDANDVARGLSRVFASETARQHMAAAATNLIATRFNCMAAARELLRVYQNAIDKTSSRRVAQR